jgi:hypothetical protein
MHVEIPPYLTQLKEHLRSDPKIWKWFADEGNKDKYYEEVKSYLLKNTYRLDETEHAGLYLLCETVKQKLGLMQKVIFYQATGTAKSNAAVFTMPGEAHVVFSGTILKALSEQELKSVIAHELSHLLLFTISGAQYDIADRIISSIANDVRSSDVYMETARLYKIYMELFCDRGALLVTGDIEPVITSLIKIDTGLEKVSAASYIKQADEIFSAEQVSTEHISHPEDFIRVKALEVFGKRQELYEEKIAAMIEGKTELGKLNIFSQLTMQQLTISLLQLIMKPDWMQTEVNMSLCRQYEFSFLLNADILITESLQLQVSRLGISMKEYLSYVLYDFFVADAMLEDISKGYIFQLMEYVGLKELFEHIVKKEMKLTDRKLDELKQRMEAYTVFADRRSIAIMEE